MEENKEQQVQQPVIKKQDKTVEQRHADQYRKENIVSKETKEILYPGGKKKLIVVTTYKNGVKKSRYAGMVKNGKKIGKK